MTERDHLCTEPIRICGDCGHREACGHEEEEHNTGECGCAQAEQLCWKAWWCSCQP